MEPVSLPFLPDVIAHHEVVLVPVQDARKRHVFLQCTKSQQALKLQQEQNNQERKERNRKKKEAEEHRMFELKQQKKREKHKGH